jgi:hypothetical protein
MYGVGRELPKYFLLQSQNMWVNVLTSAFISYSLLLGTKLSKW